MDRKRILVVDDEPLVRESMRLMLGMDEHLVDLVGSGTEALEHYSSEKYSVVLTDFRMPGMNGLELAREIRSRCRLPGQPQF